MAFCQGSGNKGLIYEMLTFFRHRLTYKCMLFSEAACLEDLCLLVVQGYLMNAEVTTSSGAQEEALLEQAKLHKHTSYPGIDYKDSLSLMLKD